MATYYTLLFNRLGRAFAHGGEVRTYQATLDSEYASTAAEWSGADLEWISPLSQGLSSRKLEATKTLEDLDKVARRTLLETTDANFPLLEKTLRGALVELVRQMVADSETVDGSTVTVGSVTAGASNAGDGTFLVSKLAPVVDAYGNRAGGGDLQYVPSETIIATCRSDATLETVDEGGEIFRVYGQRAVSRFDEDWPTGSGADLGISAVSPYRDGGFGPSRSVVTNGDFETFTANTPEHFSVLAGTPGTHILAAGSGYSGSNALKFVGDGSTTPKIRQRFRVTSETLGHLLPDRPYSISFAAKYATLAPGVSLRVAIEDSSGTRLNAGVIGREMSRTVTSASLSTSWTLYTGTCFSPVEIPKGARIVVEATGNIANTSEVFVDHLTIAEMRSLGPGLPAVQLVAGADPFRYGDSFQVAVTNNDEGALQREFERFFGLRSLGIALPSTTAGTETILDSVIA